MRIRVLKLLCGLSTLALGLGTVSAGAQTAQLITLDDAIARALERNVALLQARTDAQLSEVAVSEARMQFVPSLSLNTTGSQAYGRYFSSAAGAFIDQTTNSLGLGASSGVTLFAGFHDMAALRQAKLNREASRLDLGRAQETAIFTVVANFLALLQQQDQLQVLRQNLAGEMTFEAQIRQYVAAGARASADLYQQQANVASAQLTVIQAENAVAVSKVALMRTLQLDPLGTYEFQAPTIEAISNYDSVELRELIARALGRRVDLSAEEARVEAQEQSVRVAGAGYWPTVSLTAGYGSSYSNALPLGVRDQLDAYRNGSVSVTISVPVFDRGVTRNAVHRAQLHAQNERVALESAREEIQLQVRNVYLDYHAAREALVAAELRQHTAQLAAQSAQERFKAGTAILVEVFQERAPYIQAESALVAVRYDLALQNTLMKYYLGEIQGEDRRGQDIVPSLKR